MSAQRQKAIQTGKELTTMPEDLRSPQAKLVFHSLDAAGSAGVDELATRLGMQKMTLLAILKSLQSQNFVEKAGNEYAVAA